MPSLVNFWIRGELSPTYTYPSESTATPLVPVNCPSPPPKGYAGSPQRVKKYVPRRCVKKSLIVVLSDSRPSLYIGVRGSPRSFLLPAPSHTG